jgi:hypothetical protein
MYYKVVHSFKKQESTVVHFIEFEFFWYHGFNGNKVRVSKSIKSILIGTHLHIPNIYTSRRKKLKKKKKNYVRDL